MERRWSNFEESRRFALKGRGRSLHGEKKRIAIYIEASRCLFTELCTMSDQSTTGRNLYSNTLSISIIGEELPAHTMAKRLLYPPRPRTYRESLEGCVALQMLVPSRI